jgi:hypothetical protein
MYLSDLGIDKKTKAHNRKLTWLETRFLGILWTDHTGYNSRISANDLAFKFWLAIHNIDPRAIEDKEERQRLLGKCMGERQATKRMVRTLQNHLLIQHENIPILSKAGDIGGYWLAETEAEAAEFYHSFRKRGMTGLIKGSRGKRSVLADIVKQLTFEFEHTLESERVPAGAVSIEIVDNLLEALTAEPEKFRAELQRLGRKFGSVLLPKEQVTAMQVQVENLQRMVAQIGGLQ